MDLIKLYYYTSIPLITCNMLFYSITALSTSITSSQNVVKFISEHKGTDIEMFHYELEITDAINTLKIIESLIFDILKKYSNNTNEFEELKLNLTSNPFIRIEENDCTIIEMKTFNQCILERIDEPIRYALLTTIEIAQQVTDTIDKCHTKINNHKNSYIKNIISLCLQHEIRDFKKQINLLEKRMHLLFDLLKIYCRT